MLVKKKMTKIHEPRSYLLPAGPMSSRSQPSLIRSAVSAKAVRRPVGIPPPATTDRARSALPKTPAGNAAKVTAKPPQIRKIERPATSKASPQRPVATKLSLVSARNNHTSSPVAENRSRKDPKQMEDFSVLGLDDRKEALDVTAYLISRMLGSSAATGTAAENPLKKRREEKERGPTEHQLYDEAKMYSKQVLTRAATAKSAAVGKSQLDIPESKHRDNVPDNLSETGTYTIDDDLQSEKEIQKARQSIGAVFGVDEGDKDERQPIIRPVIISTDATVGGRSGSSKDEKLYPGEVFDEESRGSKQSPKKYVSIYF